ncbi:DUF3883 domain-containing protein [Flavobacterium psychrotrophum]|uniref:DUF3883 domain-containing protein n=1 Tax=Flavobacterium psychrotrophum TaxID=2294119 RepID=UPI000E311417|nr:DUF3883 domain-containing protein [Flavobacterium psychrotrophum]
MTTIQTAAIQQIETTKEVYLRSPSRMFSEYNGEKENIKNYNGRQLLEMIQNADDAASKARKKKRVLIRLKGEKLMIANTGHPFSEEGLNSIFHSHLSPKQAEEDQIGKKGLGFRSILSWAKSITIHSHDLHVAFSEDYSRKVLDELLKDGKFRKQYDRLNKKKLMQPISTLVCPEVLDSQATPEQQFYDTIIEVALLSNAMDEVKAQILSDLDGEILLFLNNLEEIILDLEGGITRYTRTVNQDGDVVVSTFLEDGTQNKRLWKKYALKGKFSDQGPSYELCMAWCDGFDPVKDMVYSFFRTKVPIRCSGILHGTFELNADRNLIIDDPQGYNKKLLALLPELLAGAAAKIAAATGVPSYAALEFLTVEITGLDDVIKPKTLRDAVLREAKQVPIFPTTANTYITWDDEDRPVYYPEKILSEYLDPKAFANILQNCENPKAFNILNELHCGSYNTTTMMEDIVSRCRQIPQGDYAQLIDAVHEHMGKNEDLGETTFFYGTNYQPLSFDKSVFLPDNQKKFSLPSNLDIQIIDEQLTTELLSLMEVADIKSLAQALPKFNLKEYRFEELVTLLIRHYSGATRNEEIIELHNYLFSLYSAYGIVQQQWKGEPCPILSVKGTIVMANKSYLGREYGHTLTGELYRYDKTKNIAGPKKMMVPQGKEEDWTKYLLWLGAATRPRLLLYTTTGPYAEYNMKTYDYRSKVDDYLFKDYTKFKEELTNGYGTVNVSSIDDLEKLLKNNTPEKVLHWISEDTLLLQLLERDVEPEGSVIYFDFYNTKVWRKIGHTKMRSFIRWTIANTAWLHCEQGFSETPSRCTTAAYVNEDFQGLVEKPSLDYEILRNYGISREKADYLLSIIGVHKSVSSFSTEMLFNILLKLPSMENGEKKARTIYNQLSANFDDKMLERIDEEDPAYKKFISEGEVLCKNGEFIVASSCVYVNDKRYGEAILRQFNVIDIDRRRGKDKIRRLFGVQPLENIALKISQTPMPHSLNNAFVAEMENFKPYVYVLRREVDGGSEKNTIRDTRFSLIPELSLHMEIKGEQREILLGDYEYFYERNRSTVHICCRDATDIQELRDDVQFCSAIADAFSAMLDVDSQRQQIRELFSKSGNSRDEILRAELDDQQLKKLAHARNLLGIISNPKLDFWKSFTRCHRSNNLKPKDDSDQQLLVALTKAFPKFATHITQCYDTLNYNDLCDEDSAQVLIDLLTATGLKVSKFNAFHYPQLDLQPLFKLYFRQQLTALTAAFTSSYHEMCRMDANLRPRFLEKIQQFQHLEGVPVNEVDYKSHADTELARVVLDTFGIDTTALANVANKDLSIARVDNLDTFYTTNPTTDRLLFTQYLGENPTMESLLYFEEELPAIATAFESWMGSRTEAGKNATKGSKKLKVGDSDLFYNTLAELKGQIDALFGEAGFGNITSKTIKTNATDTKKKAGGSPGTPIGIRPKVPKEDVGFLGEYLVFQYLNQTLDNKQSIKWVSEYARHCGNNICGKDGLGYDIEYIPNGAKYPRYIEVKVVGSREDAFHITSPEVRFGEAKKRNYEIFLVKNIADPANAEIERIQGLFDYGAKSSFSDNDRFSVVNDNYIIKFKKV